MTRDEMERLLLEPTRRDDYLGPVANRTYFKLRLAPQRP